MAGAAMTAKTRVVLTRRRADTRAATEPRDTVVYEPEIERTNEHEPRVQPQRKARQLEWLGVVVSPPLIGASLVIGTWLRPEFRITSAVTKIIEREDGVIVMTASKSGYFVKHSGDVYFVGKVD